MSGICSAHRWKKAGCQACEATVYDLIPNYDELLAQAEAAGKRTCECGFTYYLTTDSCPRCSRFSTVEPSQD